MKIKPNPNKTVNGKPLVVVDIAHGDDLPPEGREVHRNAYWVRRLEVGDVVLCEDEAQKAESAEDEAQKAKSAEDEAQKAEEKAKSKSKSSKKGA